MMSIPRTLSLALGMLSVAAHAETTVVLNAFDDAAQIDRFAGRLRYTHVSPITTHKNQGTGACECRFFTDGSGMGTAYVRAMYLRGDFPYADWRPYTDLAMDALNPQESNVPLHVVVRDAKGTQADMPFTLSPGNWHALRVPCRDLAAKGLDLGSIRELRVAMPLDAMSAPVRVYIDHLRLIGTDTGAIAEARRKEDQTAEKRLRPLPERTEWDETAAKLEPTGQVIHRAQDVPVAHETDVIVAGGGLAGTMAAIAAAREGAHVLLIERAGALGGMATSGMVPIAWNLTGTGGMQLEFSERLEKRGGTAEKHNPEIIKMVLNEMCHEAGVKLLLYTWVTGAITDGNVTKGVFIESKSGPQAVLGKIVIDSTGDGDVAASAGAEFEVGRGRDEETQTMTLIFQIGNVNTIEMKKPGVDFNELFRKAKKAGDISARFAGGVCGGVVVSGEHGVYAVNSINVPLVDGLSASDLTYAQLQCQRDILELVSFFRKYVPGCTDCYVSQTAPWMGVRETRRIVGEYMLTGEDVMTCREFDDTIAYGFYPIDIHVPDGTGDAVGMHPPRGYDIPYRILVPRKVEGLLVAGRCVSADHIAHGSLRVMGTTMTLGEAAGFAAALSIRKGVLPRDLDPTLLRNTIRKHNGLPAKPEPVPDNLALATHGTKARADSHYKSGKFPANAAIDGYATADSSSRWLSAKTPPPHWIELDFGTEQTFSFVRLHFWAHEQSDNASYAARGYSLQVPEGDAWKDICTVSGNDKRVPEHQFPPITSSKLRLWITDSCKADDMVRLREIEVHATPPDK